MYVPLLALAEDGLDGLDVKRGDNGTHGSQERLDGLPDSALHSSIRWHGASNQSQAKCKSPPRCTSMGWMSVERGASSAWVLCIVPCLDSHTAFHTIAPF